MVKNLHISILLLTFAIEIVGGHVPANGGFSTSPFSVCKVELIKKVDIMTKRKTVEEVKRDFQNKWGDLYDYSKITEYKNNKQQLPIVCHKHGEFPMSANSHLRGRGCPKCADERTGDRCRMTLADFLRRAKEIHGERYDYSLVTEDTFTDSHTDIEIICSKHGKFKQSPHEHLSGRGCYWCGKESMAQKQALTRDDIVRRCNEIFDNKYDYSLFTEYHSKKDIIQVICPKHGAWPVSVSNHLYRQSGCPSCKRSLGEERIAKFLDDNNVEYFEQYRVQNESLLCINMYMMIDFFLPKYNIAIEYNGIQHYEENTMFDLRTLEEQQERDNAVRLYCKEHEIKLIEIPYTEFENIEDILKKELKIKCN
jgi:hypothetical protein